MIIKFRLAKRCVSGALTLALLAASVQIAVAAAPQVSSPVTSAVSTHATQAPVALTDNGAACADIYISPTADGVETFAVQEFQDTIERVSGGAQIPLVAEPSGAAAHIVVGTPASLPALSSMFPDELEWIGDTDGFSIQKSGNTIYIFGTCSKGAINGVYDFLEENTGILWTRGVDELGTLFDEQPTIYATAYNYHEKSPFSMRGWLNLGLSEGKNPASPSYHTYDGMRLFEGRNKNNFMGMSDGRELGTTTLADGYKACINGSIPWGGNPWDFYRNNRDSHPDWFMNNRDGTAAGDLINYNWMKKDAADAYAEALAAYAAKEKREYINYGIEDHWITRYVHEDENGNLIDDYQLPFTTDEGNTVTPEDENYRSTIAFTFMNRVAAKVKELNPALKVSYLAYIYAETPPALTQIEDNIIITFAPIYADEHTPIETSDANAKTRENLEGWLALTDQIEYYAYTLSFMGEYYSRPIHKKVQEDYQYFAELGIPGMIPEAVIDSTGKKVDQETGLTLSTNRYWNMNNLYAWLLYRLQWNPYENLEALKLDFCEKAYGAAEAEMLEYYRLIEEGWDNTQDYVWYGTMPDTYIKALIIDQGNDQAILDTLLAALAKLDEGSLEYQRIKPIYDTLLEQITLYRKFVPEDGVAKKSDSGKAALTAQENLDFDQGPWADAIPLTVFKTPQMVDPVRQGLEVRLLWDDENFYVASRLPGRMIQRRADSEPFLDVAQTPPSIRNAPNAYAGTPVCLETYLCGDRSNKHHHSVFFRDQADGQEMYLENVVPVSGPYNKVGENAWESYSKTVAEGPVEDTYWINVMVVPFATLGTTANSAKLCGNFVFNIEGEADYMGWCGGAVWSTSSFRTIELLGQEMDPEEARAALQTLYDESILLVQGNYTTESWTKFQQALTGAQTTLTNGEATPEELSLALSALQKAVKSLDKFASAEDKASLLVLYNEWRLTSNVNVEPTSWETFRTALDAAKAILDGNATKSEVNKALAALKAAASGLIYYATYEELAGLRALYSVNADLVQGAYSDSSWAAFQSALDAAAAVLEAERPLRIDVQDAVTGLNRAVSSLETDAGDKSELRALVEEYKNAGGTYYSPKSYERLKQMLAEAKAVLDKPRAAQEEINLACSNLTIAVNALAYNAPAETALSVAQEKTAINDTLKIGDGLFQAKLIKPDSDDKELVVGRNENAGGYFYGIRYKYVVDTGGTPIEEDPRVLTDQCAIEIPFVGTSFEISSILKAPYWASLADIYVDGDRIGVSDAGLGTTHQEGVIFSSGDLPYGKHLLRIQGTTNISTKNKRAAAGGTQFLFYNFSKITFQNTSSDAVTIDLADLQILCDTNANRMAKDYDGGFDVFQDALDAARAILADGGLTYTQAEVDAATAALQSAVSGLVPVPVTYAVTASATTGGSITPAGISILAAGASQTYTVQAAQGHFLAALIVDGMSVPRAPAYTFESLSSPHTIHAVFAQSAPSV